MDARISVLFIYFSPQQHRAEKSTCDTVHFRMIFPIFINELSETVSHLAIRMILL